PVQRQMFCPQFSKITWSTWLGETGEARKRSTMAWAAIVGHRLQQRLRRSGLKYPHSIQSHVPFGNFGNTASKYWSLIHLNFICIVLSSPYPRHAPCTRRVTHDAGRNGEIEKK